MKEYNIVSYRQEYKDAIINGWNRNLRYDPINKERFQKLVLLDENFDKELALVLLVDKKVAGFCMGIKRKYPYLTRGLEETRGWITTMYVDCNLQCKGYGTMLLQEAESRLKECGVAEITLCAYSPNYFTPGIDLNYESGIKFFEKQGYTRGSEAVSMQQPLFTYRIPDVTEKKIEDLKLEGIKFVPYDECYMEKLINFAEEEFGAGWTKNIMDSIRNSEAEKTILLAVDKNQKILGYCMRKIDGNDSRFGPIGVRQSLRSKGIGGVLFDLQMRAMQERGIYYAYFLWTHGDAMRFYERHGMHVYRTYQLYRKQI